MNAVIRMPKQARSAAENDPRWTALSRRDRRADGTFFYSVRTTGVYCRPSCGARLPRPENVAFHATRADAEAAGFRPCKRCRPEQPPLSERHARTVAEICRHIERSETIPPLAELARRARMSPYHFHRLFKSVTGLTPRGYATAHRAKKVREGLGRGRSVTEAVYDAGFNSSGRFYEAADRVLGMKPASYRKGGAGADIRFAVGECSLGSILVASTERGVCTIQLGSNPDALVRNFQDQFPRANLIGGDREFERLVAGAIALVETPGRKSGLPLDIRGTAFQQRVWQALRRIPAGRTATYSQIARRIGAPKAVRAVAHACATNRIAVAIPCHRVVRTDGSLAGYRWGVERKRALLEREANT